MVQDLRNYPGEYAPSNKDFVRCVGAKDQMKFSINSNGGKANLILRGATNNATPAEFKAVETQINKNI